MDTTTDALRDAEAALTRVAAVSFAALGDAALLELATRAEQVGRLVDAIRVEAAAQIEHRSRRELGETGLSRRHGYSRGSHLIEAVTRTSSADAARRIRVGQNVTPRTTPAGTPLPALFPVVGEAMRAGMLGMEAAAHIVRHLGSAADHAAVDDLIAAETVLVEQAVTVGADLIADQARVWRDHLDTDGAAPRSERQHRMRRFTLGRERGDGMTPFSGLADPVAAGMLRAGFAVHRRKVRMVDGEAGCSRAATSPLDTDPALGAEGISPDDPTAEDVVDDDRTHEQRDFDILMGIITTGIRAEPGFTPGGRASVIATVSLKDLHDGVGVGWIDDVRDSVAVGMIDELACDAGYEIGITNDAGALVALTSKLRFFTRRQRRALAARDGGCVFPACGAPAAWCDAHHVIEDHHHGPTNVSNGVLLCPEHHHYFHTSRYRMKMIRGRPHLLAPPDLDPTRTWRPLGTARLEQHPRVRVERARRRDRARQQRPEIGERADPSVVVVNVDLGDDGDPGRSCGG